MLHEPSVIPHSTETFQKQVAAFFRLLIFPVSFAAGVLTVVVLQGCEKKAESEYVPQYGNSSAIRTKVNEYIFAVHPLHNPARFFEVYQPLVDYINNSTTEFYIKLEASRDYNTFEQKLFQRKFHFALPNPYQSVQSIEYGYKIFGKMGDDEQFRGIIIVRKNSGIKKINDLRGAAISFPSATALAAAMMPKYYMKVNGLNVEKDADCRYVGSQESSIMNVFIGNTKAGCTWPQPWESFEREHATFADSLVVQWQTQPLINNGLVVRNDVPEKHKKIFENALYSLHTVQEGRTILQRINLTQFEKISQTKYVSRVQSFLDKYIKEFGSLPQVGQRKE